MWELFVAADFNETEIYRNFDESVKLNYAN